MTMTATATNKKYICEYFFELRPPCELAMPCLFGVPKTHLSNTSSHPKAQRNLPPCSTSPADFDLDSEKTFGTWYFQIACQIFKETSLTYWKHGWNKQSNTFLIPQLQQNQMRSFWRREMGLFIKAHLRQTGVELTSSDQTKRQSNQPT